MVVKLTRGRFTPARSIAAPASAATPLYALSQRVDEIVVLPQSDLENRSVRVSLTRTEVLP